MGNAREIKKDELEKKLVDTMTSTMTDPAKMRALTSHYRITGLYNYSFLNTIMVMIQGGTIAQSFNGWKKLRRFVKKGQRSTISIFRPWFKKVTDEKTGEEKQKLLGFGLSPVFDIAQTDGEDLQYDHNSEDTLDADYETLKGKAVEKFSIEIAEEVTGAVRGSTDGKKIRVSSMSNNADRVRTLIHELAHVVHGHAGDRRAKTTTAGREVEAEGSTLLVLSFLGADVTLSESYIKNWKRPDEKLGAPEIKRIVSGADKIIKALFVEEKSKAVAA